MTVLSILTAGASAARAQATIAGVVTDATGAVLPGVTVEASSPVLLEKVRAAITDTEGIYRIVDLRPGVHSVSFSLPGFSTIRRDGIELSGTFTATVNAETVEAALDETITVSGQSPVVDLQNVVHERVNVSSTGTFLDIGSFLEITYEFGAASTESATGGVHVNFVPRDGGNQFTGSFFGAITTNELQSENVTDELRARGLGVGNELARVWDVNAGLGVPIRRDVLWFFGSGRYWGMKDLVAGMWHSKNPLAFIYEPDYSRRAIDEQWLSSGSLRLTWQLTPKQKVNSYVLEQGRCICHNMVSATRSPEASRRARTLVNRSAQATWHYVMTNRALLEAGGSYYLQVFAFDPQPESWSDDILAVTALSTGLNFRATSLGKTGWRSPVVNWKTSLRYVTGSHSFKAGLSLQHGYRDQVQTYNGDINMQLLNGVPRSAIVLRDAIQYRERPECSPGRVRSGSVDD